MRAEAGIRDAWHGVQFYDHDAQLSAAAGDYLGAGFSAGDTLVVVATAAHHAAFRDQLTRDGHDVDGASARGQLITLDAHETLSRFWRKARPNERLFRATIEPLLARSRASQSRMRIYGEMVDLLWKDGSRAGAILLEQLWNDIHEPDSFWLMCGYKREGRSSSGVPDICAVHTHVIQTRRGPTKVN